MSLVLGTGTTSPRQARWAMLGILIILLLANGAFKIKGGHHREISHRSSGTH
jgi:fatty-acid desaturase